MKQLKINNTSTPYWCVVVPVEIYEVIILDRYTLVGAITSSGMDEEVRDIVGKADSIELYMDYANTECDQYSFKTAHASALSLLQHNQITLTADTKAVVVKQIT